MDHGQKVYLGNHSLKEEAYKLFTYDLDSQKTLMIPLYTEDMDANSISMFSLCIVVFEGMDGARQERAYKVFNYEGEAIANGEMRFDDLSLDSVWTSRLFCLGEIERELIFQYQFWYDVSNTDYMYKKIPLQDEIL